MEEVVLAITLTATLVRLLAVCRSLQIFVLAELQHLEVVKLVAHAIASERSRPRWQVRVGDLFAFKHVLEDGLWVLVVANLVLCRESNDLFYGPFEVSNLLSFHHILARRVIVF